MGPLIVLMKYLHGHNLHNLHVVINLSKGLLSLFVLVERKARSEGSFFVCLTFIQISSPLTILSSLSQSVHGRTLCICPFIICCLGHQSSFINTIYFSPQMEDSF